jgi:hypothetical protein
MPVLAQEQTLSSGDSALERLERFIATQRTKRQPSADFEQFERELHRYVVAAECEVLSEELARWDVDMPRLAIDGESYRQVLRSETVYLSAAGPVRVERSLYGRGRAGEVALCPVELRAGIVEGYWTPRAARQAIATVAQMPPGEAAKHFAELENMQPSRSSLDRLPKALDARWEAHREDFEAALRAQGSVPAQAVTVAVSLDGVMVPMRDGERHAKRAQSVAAGKATRGPAGYREVGCATLSFHDRDGERLSTLRLARMPQAKKATLKAMVTAELEAVRAQHPALAVVKLADGAKDNWTYLSQLLPGGTELVDFYHAAEHLKVAFDQVYGTSGAKAGAAFDKYRRILRDEHDGVEKVIRALAYHRKRYPRRKKLFTELKYFRRHRHRMRYARAATQHLPIGSGVVEAACKTLVTQRMKGAGMRWRHAGGQAILTWRALLQSDRFVPGWNLVAQTYKKPVTIPDNVVAFPARTQPVKLTAI